jgi:hypothetical protein
MWVNILLKAVLFMLLVPGVHLTIPPGASLREQALIHGVVFAVANYFAYKYVRPMMEGFDTFHPDTKVDHECPPNSIKCPSGDCKLKGDIYGMC